MPKAPGGPYTAPACLVRVHGVFGPYSPSSLVNRLGPKLVGAAIERELDWVGERPWWTPFDVGVNLLAVVEDAIKRKGRMSMDELYELRGMLTVAGKVAEGGR